MSLSFAGCSCLKWGLSTCAAPASCHASFDMTPLSAMWGISAAIQGANPRHMAWPIPKRGLHVKSRAVSCETLSACAVAAELLFEQVHSPARLAKRGICLEAVLQLTYGQQVAL